MAQRRSVTVLGAGDVLLHPPVWQQARADARAEGRTGFDFRPMLADVAPAIRRAGLATCELETPLAKPSGPFYGYPTFSVPPQILPALRWAGYDSCTTASNHTLDEGPAGVRRTLNDLDRAGLKHTGSARSAAEARRPVITRIRNGIKIAQLAYSFSFNGYQVPADEPWLANEISIPKILAAARRAKRAGADIVVVSLHWGIEYDPLATTLQKQQARRLLASPNVDVILGDHAHVVQPMQKIGRKWVIYCMGNEIARHDEPNADNTEGAMPMFTFTEVRPHHFRITRVEAVPTLVRLRPRLRVIDLPRALARPNLRPGLRTTYRRAYHRIVAHLDAYGARRDGLVIAG